MLKIVIERYYLLAIGRGIEMLLRITDHCKMACNHCFINATPKGKHMEFSTFMNSVKLANKLGAKVLLLSGGEPTDNPNFIKFLNFATLNFSGIITVISHGAYIEDKELCDKYFGDFPKVQYQITNDKRYYPKRLNRIRAGNVERKYKNVMFCWEIGGEIFPQGRARKHMKITEINAKVLGPRCFNLRSFIHHPMIPDISHAIQQLEKAGKFCTPSVNINGSIAMGESNQCQETMNIKDSIFDLTEKVKNSNCNDCGMLSKLSETHHRAINFKCEGV